MDAHFSKNAHNDSSTPFLIFVPCRLNIIHHIYILHTVAVNKKLMFRSVSTIILPFYAIVFAPFVRTRICAFIVFTFACTHLIGRRDRTAIMIVLRHV